MNPILNAGVMIGVLCGLCTFAMGFTGWYRDPSMNKVFLTAVIVIEVAGLYWGLRQTAREGRTYAGQVVDGTLMAVVAGVIIVASSLVFTLVLFPDYFEAVRSTGADSTPMSEAMSGFIGTLVTGILASAVIAIWVRARPDRQRAAP